MFKLKTTAIGTIYKVISILNEISPSCNITILANGIYIQLKDVASILICEIIIDSSFFQEWIYEKDTSICIDLDSFKKILKCSGTEIILEHQEDSKLKISLISGVESMVYNMNLLNYVESKLSIPEYTGDVIIDIHSDKLKKIISDLNSFCVDNTIKITVSESNLNLLVDTGNGKLESNIPQGPVTSEIQDFSKLYSMKYVKLIADTMLSDTININFILSDDLPSYFNIHSENIKIKFFISSKTE